MSLLAVTGCLALLMSVAGVYGVTSYTTSRRTREIGVRMALGATPGNVHALIFRQGFLTVAVGTSSWVVPDTGSAARHFAESWSGSHPEIRRTSGSRPAIVSLTAAIACWVPARRATRIDPMSALRQE